MESMEEQLSEGDGRLNKILFAIDEMKSVLSGRHYSFVPYTHTGEKKFSKEKTNIFIGRLLEYIQEKKESEGVEFSEKERQVYEGFLYCAVSYCSYYFQEEHMTFETILMMTDDFLLLKFRQMLLDQKRGCIPEDEDLERHFKNYGTLFNPDYNPDYDFPDFEYDIWYILTRFLHLEGFTLYKQEEYYLEAMACIRKATNKLKELSQRQMRDGAHEGL